MLKLIPFKPRHAEVLALHQGTLHLLASKFEQNYFDALIGPYAFTGLDPDGHILGAAGIFEYWPGRGEAWAMLDAKCKPYFRDIHRACKRNLEVAPYHRIEAVVDEGYEEGHRWCRLLGFELEAPLMKSYFTDKRSASLYALVK